MKIIEMMDKQYPKRLLEIKDPPKKLYVEGNEKLLNKNSLAIVGSRRCSEYGIKYAKKFAKEIADKGITIISGLALGIDTIAHEISQNCEGKTIAVLGSGLNKIYPEENVELFQKILENGGCIISEYKPNESVNMKNFPKRNRIISGISNGILVIEAGYKSGSTITGRYGFEQNKNVFCLPRNIGDLKGVGTNELIQKGAKLVTNPQEILKEFGIIESYSSMDIKTKSELLKIKKEYKLIYQHISYVPKNIEYLTIKSGLTIVELHQKLVMMELEGYIKSLPGNNYVRV